MTEVTVLLFNPPAPDGRAYTREGRCTQEAGVWGTQWPPLSLATAAALLRREGHRVTLRDYPAAGLDSRALAEDLRHLRPAYAIWSTGTPTLTPDLALARLVREQAPEVVTAVIGTHVTVRPEEALEEAALRVVIRGEPEGINPGSLPERRRPRGCGRYLLARRAGRRDPAQPRRRSARAGGDPGTRLGRPRPRLLPSSPQGTAVSHGRPGPRLPMAL